MTNSDLLKRALEAKIAEARRFCIDPFKLDSRPSEKQQAILEDTTSLHIYVVAGNQSGKSMAAARIVAWKFEENHPYWNRPADWGNEPLLIIVAGRISTQLEELWRTKIEPFLTPGCYEKPAKSGTALVSVTHKTNGNKILFTSHDKAEQAKEKVQSFVAHHFWLDEMPSHPGYIEEAHRRVDARRGQFIATMTPKVKNDQIRHMIDGADPSIATIYRMGKLDNPIYHGREEEEWAKIAHLPPSNQKNIMYGDWLDSEDRVFNYHSGTHSKPVPTYYSKKWSHVLSVDPALSSKSGLTLFAFDELLGRWWVVDSIYFREDSPSKIVKFVYDYSAPFNIVRRICDTEPWFYQQYWEEYGVSWLPIYKKVERKKDLIAAVQQLLDKEELLHFAGLTDLEREYSTAEWKEGFEGEKIKNSQRFHLIDSLQYGIDGLPLIETIKPMSYDASLMEAARVSMAVEDKMKSASSSRERKRLRNHFKTLRRKNRWYF